MNFGERLQHGFNAFKNPEVYPKLQEDMYGGYYARPDRPRFHFGNERSLLASVLNRIAIDVASLTFVHARKDKDGRFKEEIDSNLDKCLNLAANADQTGREFIQDIVMSMCDEGCVAVIPTHTDINYINKDIDGLDIFEMRVAKIVEWYPSQIKVNAYDETTGKKIDLIISKKNAAIIENPLYSVMNEPNSTLRRLIAKLNLLDDIDAQSGSSGKLDMIMQVPYMLKSAKRKGYVEQRRKEIETQLADSRYGIAYTDGTERIVQLNRPVENNLMSQIEYLTTLFYSQIGMTEAVLNGTANEQEMLNYHNRTIEPIASAIVNSFRWKFLTKTARTQGQDIMVFRDPFRLVPMEKLAETADKFLRNEIMSPNEFRGVLGMKPDDDPESNELRNRNLNKSDAEMQKTQTSSIIQNGSKSSFRGSDLDSLMKELTSRK